MRKTAIIMVVATVVVAGLGGCQILRNPTDPNISFRAAGNLLEVTVCRDIDVSEIWLEQSTEEGPLEDVWRGQVALDLSANSSFTLNDLPPAVIVGDTHLAAGDHLGILLKSQSDDSISADVSIPTDGMPRDGWLQSDGEVTTTACARVDGD